jgi:hypothetical protein
VRFQIQTTTLSWKCDALHEGNEKTHAGIVKVKSLGLLLRKPPLIAMCLIPPGDTIQTHSMVTRRAIFQSE